MALATTTLKTRHVMGNRRTNRQRHPGRAPRPATVLGRAIFGLIKVAERQGLWLVVVLALLQFPNGVVVAWHYTLGGLSSLRPR
jgi:hypothetical protein